MHSYRLLSAAMIVTLSFTSALFAHPGHGRSDADSVVHLAEPVHALPIFGVWLVSLVIVLWIAKRMFALSRSSH